MNKHKLILTSSVANSFEWYDYALFGHFANNWAKIFPNSDPSISFTLCLFSICRGLVLMRPIGVFFWSNRR